MSSRARKSQKLTKRDSSDSTKHARTSHDNEEYSNRGNSGSDKSESGSVLEPDFAAIGVGEFLELDPRPTFVVTADLDLDNGFEPTFSNEALRSNQSLVRAIAQLSQNSSPPSSPKISSTAFRSWMKSSVRHGSAESSNPPTFSFYGLTWTSFALRGRWTIISGCDPISRGISGNLPLRSESPKTLQPVPRRRLQDQNETQTDRSATPAPTQKHDSQPIRTPGTSDWTLAQPTGELSPHLIFARSIDWSSTPLGSMDSWSKEFRQVTNLVMSNPHPCALFWGDELTVMYNKPYADIVAGRKHPGLMGTGFWGPFAELWDTVGPIFRECVRTGQSIAMQEQMLPIERHGFIEETFFTWSITPLYGGTDKLLGLYNAPFETTRQTISDRRTRTLLKIGEVVSLAPSVTKFWPLVMEALVENEFDFPFALLYSITEEDTDDGSSMSSGSSQALKSCILEGSLGVPEGHPCSPSRLDLKRARGGFIPAFRDAMKTREPKLLNINDGTLSESLIEGLEWRGFGEPCKLAIVSPIRPTNGENVLGFLVLGIPA